MKKLASVILIGIVLLSSLAVVVSARPANMILIDKNADKEYRIRKLYFEDPPEHGPEIWMKTDTGWILRNHK